MSKLLRKIGLKVRENGVAGTCSAACNSIGFRISNHWKFKLLLPFERWNHIRQTGGAPDIGRINQRTMSFFEGSLLPEAGVGACSYISGGPPLLYASSYAALTFHLCGKMQSLSASEKRDWAASLQRYQSEDGLFRDASIDIPLAAQCDWWGWRHQTLHVLMALKAMDAVASRRIDVITPFQKNGYLQAWLDSRDWKNDPTSVSNEIQNLGTFLQYARDFQDGAWCGVVLEEMFDWLDRRQDAKTGLWGNRFETPTDLSQGVQTGYHIWLLYFYDQRPIQHVERIIDSCLATQNRFGGFGVSFNSSACEDIDSIDPLVRISLQSNYRRQDVQNALTKGLSWVLFNQNADGGWVFQRRKVFQYGHPLMRAELQQSAAFPSWFRTLSLAYLAQVLPAAVPVSNPWQFLRCPGHQFWNPLPHS